MGSGSFSLMPQFPDLLRGGRSYLGLWYFAQAMTAPRPPQVHLDACGRKIGERGLVGVRIPPAVGGPCSELGLWGRKLGQDCQQRGRGSDGLDGTPGEEGLLREGVPGAPSGFLAITQTPSLEGLGSAGLGPVPVGPHQKGLDWGHWAGSLSATPRGYT